MKEKGVRRCQNHSGKDRGNLEQEEPGSAKHRKLVLSSNKAQLPNIWKSLKLYDMSCVEVLCRVKYKLRKEELIAMTQTSKLVPLLCFSCQ